MSELREWKLSVQIVSETPGPDGTTKLQQKHIVDEYSDTKLEHTEKNFAIDDAVTKAVRETFLMLAEKGGHVIGKGPIKSA